MRDTSLRVPSLKLFFSDVNLKKSFTLSIFEKFSSCLKFFLHFCTEELQKSLGKNTRKPTRAFCDLITMPIKAKRCVCREVLSKFTQQGHTFPVWEGLGRKLHLLSEVPNVLEEHSKSLLLGSLSIVILLLLLCLPVIQPHI